MDDFRRLFFRGLAALVPTLLTIALLVWAYRLLNDNVGVHINRALLALLSTWVSPQPATSLVDVEVDPLKYGTPINEWDEQTGRRLTIEHKIINQSILGADARGVDEADLQRAERERDKALWEIAFVKWKLHLVGFLIAIVLVYYIGLFLASFLGRTSWRMVEGLLCRIPLIRAIYPNIKQVTDFLLSDRKVEFAGVVAVEYPRRGVWSIGLRTGGPMTKVQHRVSDELITVFIPSSPTPITGYTIQVALKDVIDLNITIDEALRFTISGGVIKPEALLPGGSQDEGS